VKNSILLFAIAATLASCGSAPEPIQSGDQPASLPQADTVPALVVVIDTTPRVTGIGGIFFESENPKATNDWYGENLGLAIDAYGSPFEFRNGNRPDEINYLRWSPYQELTGFADPSNKEFMINYRVQNIEGLVRNLRANGVTILDSIAEYPYGKFVHLMDPDGHKVELWEPIDSFFTKMGGPTTK
jgi:predicted enzyme related to lactoylglutathione lyase